MSANNRQEGGTHYLDMAKEWLRYEPTGKLYWKKTSSSKAVSGAEAGWKDKDGYLVTTIKGKKLRLARLIWSMHYGEIPDGMHVDHINNNITDNRIENLRLASPSQNSCNRRAQSNNSLGIKGCCFVNGKYRVSIVKRGSEKYIRHFNSIEEAKAAYSSESKKIHGEFCNVG